jgi:hypothetical protein
VYVLEEAQQVGDGLPLAISKHRIIDAVLRAACVGHLANTQVYR